MGRIKEQYYYVYETFADDQGGVTEQVEHKYTYDFDAVYNFFGFLDRYKGWYYTFTEGDTYFTYYIRDRRINEDAENWVWIQLKKWKGWQKYFRFVYRLTIQDGGKESVTYYLNQKELIEKIEKLEHKKIYLWQPDGYGTPISVYERRRTDVEDTYERPWENEPIKGYSVEYRYVEDKHKPRFSRFESDKGTDEEEAPKIVKKRPTPVDDTEEEEMVDLPF